MIKRLPNLERYTQQSTRLSTNSHAGPSDPLAIRGASRPTVAGRLRRNAVSNAIATSASAIPVRVKLKPVEDWRELVHKRWNPETRYLNLDVSFVTLKIQPFTNSSQPCSRWLKMKLLKNSISAPQASGELKKTPQWYSNLQASLNPRYTVSARITISTRVLLFHRFKHCPLPTTTWRAYYSTSFVDIYRTSWTCHLRTTIFVTRGKSTWLFHDRKRCLIFAS